MTEQIKELSYKQTKIEIRQLIMKCVEAAEKQKVSIDFNKLNAQIQLDYGVGQLSIKRIIENLQTLGYITYHNGLLKIVHKKAVNGA